MMAATISKSAPDLRPSPAVKPHTVLSVRNLSARFETHGGSFLAIEDVSFDLHKGRTLALVGESGCGKSVTAQAIMRLLPKRIARVEAGSAAMPSPMSSSRTICPWLRKIFDWFKPLIPYYVNRTLDPSSVKRMRAVLTEMGLPLNPYAPPA
jgi:ABC-type dipeptide/oligopeptide/nickel transport system ATPase component